MPHQNIFHEETQPTSFVGVRYLTINELTRRWTLSHRTLENWRQAGNGPNWVKFDYRVVSPTSEITSYELADFNRGAE